MPHNPTRALCVAFVDLKNGERERRRRVSETGDRAREGRVALGEALMIVVPKCTQLDATSNKRRRPETFSASSWHTLRRSDTPLHRYCDFCSRFSEM